MSLCRRLARHPARIGAGCCVLLLAGTLKLWFSSAGAVDLRRLLAPTARLAGIYTSTPFTFDPQLGYVNHQLQVIIAPVCSGFNFMLIVLCMVSFQGLFTLNRSPLLWKWLLTTPLLAYGYTVVVNTIRIILSIWLFEHRVTFGWFTPERIHRLSGILVYYLMLLLLFAGVNAALKKYRNAGQTHFSLFLALFPLFWYTGITLAVPLLHRNSYTPAFWEHSASILCVCCVLTVAFTLAGRLRQTYRSPGKSKTSHGQTIDPDS